MQKTALEYNHSPQYWEQRFSSRDWDKNHGEAQTRFFGQLMARLIPAWAASDIKTNRRPVADLGCAEGAGTAELARLFPECEVTGIDFASSAIERARQLHPGVSFSVGNLETPPAKTQVFALSNVLEHLEDPLATLRRLSASADVRYVIVLVPLHEVVRHHEHVVTFDYNNFPIRLGRLSLAAFQELDLRGTPDETHWYGKQAFAIWAHDDVLTAAGPTLQGVLGTARQAQQRLAAAQEHVRKLERTDRQHLEELAELRRRYAEAVVELQRRDGAAPEATGLKPVESTSRVQFLPDPEAEERARELRRTLESMERSLKWRVSRAAVTQLERFGLGRALKLAHSLDSVGPMGTVRRFERKVRQRIAQSRRLVPFEVDPWISLAPLRPIEVRVLDEDFSDRPLPRFSVVTTVRNEADGIVAFLQSLARQQALPSEVILVDGGSTDETVALTREFARQAPFTLRVVDEGPCNIAAGRNKGLKLVKEDLVVFVDAGCTLRKHFFSAMVGPFDGHPDCDLVGGIYVASAAAQFAAPFVPDWRRFDAKTFLPSARAVAVRTEMARGIGGFPEHLTHTGEDTLFDIAYRRVSRTWAINRSAIVEWGGPPNEAAMLKLVRSYCRGDGESGIGDRRFGRWLAEARKRTLEPPNSREKAAFEGFVEGRDRRSMVELKRRRVRGVVVLLDPGQITDFGGEREVAELASELVRQNFKVVHVSVHGPDLAGDRYLELDQSLLELTHINDFDVEEIVSRYGDALVGAYVCGAHPALVPAVERFRRLLPRLPVVLADDDESTTSRVQEAEQALAAARLSTLVQGIVSDAPGRSARALALPIAVDARTFARGRYETRPRNWPAQGRERVVVVPFPVDVRPTEMAEFRQLVRRNPSACFVALVSDGRWGEIQQSWGIVERNVTGRSWRTPDELAAWVANAAAVVLPWDPEVAGRSRWTHRWAARAAAFELPLVTREPGVLAVSAPVGPSERLQELSGLSAIKATQVVPPRPGAIQDNVHRLIEFFYDVGR